MTAATAAGAPIGPDPVGPGASEEAFLARAAASARACGVTRLADITGLDRLGLPVWQAIRPAGRALSVHQGKGVTPRAARIGALCEAIESHCAETAAPDGPLCRFHDLPEEARAPMVSDYGRVRVAHRGFADVIAWCRATDIASGRAHFLPHALVSLDLTGGTPSPFDRSSTGLAVAAREEDAVRVAIHELIERDAVGEWRRSAVVERMARAVDLDSIPFAWFANWRERFARFDIALSVHAPAALAGVPVFACAIAGPAEFGTGSRTFTGSGAHAVPEIALFRALAEAIQSRLTLIAGTRDDILPDDYRPAGPGLRLPVPPTPPGFAEHVFTDIPEGPASLTELIARLAGLGYGQVAVKQLAPPSISLSVVKVFLPGLGSLRRSRRPR